MTTFYKHLWFHDDFFFSNWLMFDVMIFNSTRPLLYDFFPWLVFIVVAMVIGLCVNHYHFISNKNKLIKKREGSPSDVLCLAGLGDKRGILNGWGSGWKIFRITRPMLIMINLYRLVISRSLAKGSDRDPFTWVVGQICSDPNPCH